MKVTKEQIEALNPCTPGWKWYLKNQEEELLTLLLRRNESEPADSRWLFTRLMSKEQNVEIAIFSAKQVLPILEEMFHDDSRPRKAIEAAEAWLKETTKENTYAAADDDKELQKRIIYKAVEILDRDGAE